MIDALAETRIALSQSHEEFNILRDTLVEIGLVIKTAHGSVVAASILEFSLKQTRDLDFGEFLDDVHAACNARQGGVVGLCTY